MERGAAVVVVSIMMILVLPTKAGAGGGGGCAEQFSDATGAVVTMNESCFTPTVVRVDAGDTVRFVNKSPMPHTVTGASVVFGHPHKDLGQGESVSYRFDTEGTFPYYCAFHLGMVGAVVVGDGLGEPTGSAAIETDDLAATANKDAGAPASASGEGSRTGTLLGGGAAIAGAGLAGLALMRARRSRRTVHI